MKRFGLFLLACFSVLSSAAEEEREENFEFTHNRASISGLLTSSDAWQLELGYHYMFSRYIGVGASIGAWQVYFVDGWASGPDWNIDSDNGNDRPSNIYLHPSLVFKTKAIKVKQVDIGLYIEPGAMMNVPYKRVCIRQDLRWPESEYRYVGTGKGQWFAPDIRLGVCANIGPCGITAGYVISDLDVYSQFRHLSYRGQSFADFYPHKSSMRGAYLTLSYYF